MKVFRKIIGWVIAQFRSHLVISLVVTALAVVLITAGIMWAAGVFSKAVFTYLPNRSYILDDGKRDEPQTLEDILHSAFPSVDSLLKNPQAAADLIDARTLTDIVDSRLALNNLRSLDRQLTELLSREQEIIGTGKSPGSENGTEKSETSQQTGSATEGKTIRSYGGAAVQMSGEFAVPQGAFEHMMQTLAELKGATERLLKPRRGDFENLVSMPASVNMKGIWQSPDEALVHMVPSGDWLPENGYKLYRIVNGNRELIAEQLASPSAALTGNLQVKDADLIQALYQQAALTPEKLEVLEMSAEEFRNFAYRTDSLSQRPRVSGKLDYTETRNALITIPASIEQKIPSVDLMLSQPIYIVGQNETYSGFDMSYHEKYSVKQAEVSSGIGQLKFDPQGVRKFEVAQSILSARQEIATLSFVDSEFAEEAGFLLRDDLSALNLPNGTEIKYEIITPDGKGTSLSIKKGTDTKLSKPDGLMGYGLDGKVPLRWDQAQTEEERSILSGYLIERKLNGESSFKQINDEPIVISYMLDETDVFFESPVFFEDTVENGRTATYRIRSIDIFGRTSEYSDPITIKVEKVTPPNSPSIDTPVRSDDTVDPSTAVQAALHANPGKRGIVLPVHTDSSDTVRFTIYRAVAVGARLFGKPEVLADIVYDNPQPPEEEQTENTGGTFTTGGQPAAYNTEPIYKKVKGKKVNHVGLCTFTPAYPDLIYFDADIQEGCTYKYWVSAWDSWNNESVWSQSAIISVPTNAEPGIPAELSISMHPLELPDYSKSYPGIIMPDVVTYADLENASSLPARPCPAGAYPDTLKNAKKDGAEIGNFLTASSTASLILDEKYGNLPGERYLHMFVAVRGEDVLPDGTARLKWPAYSGEGLGGYVVYTPLFEPRPLEEMQNMTRTELLRMGRWKRVNEYAVTRNQLVVGGLSRQPGSISLFLVCLQPELKISYELTASGAISLDYIDLFLNAVSTDDAPEGGYVYIDWEAPDDPQVASYRVYRSEVSSFKKPIDESKLEWTLVGDNLKIPKYTERVEQSFAHYYYYKVTSVSPWGVESTVGQVQRFRVPSTKPPETPSLLLPLSRKDGVQINFSAVSHCDRYEIYRAAIPVISDKLYFEMLDENIEILSGLFESPSQADTFMTGILKKSLDPGSLPKAAALGTAVLPVSRFKTIPFTGYSAITDNIASLEKQTALDTYNWILNKFGPLALADYKDLSESMLEKVVWVKVGEVPADEDTTETVDPATGLLRPLSFIDTTARYGVRYLYTVQAWNDDNLGSSRPEPVEATPRRNRPFDPIDGLKGEIVNNIPHLSWNLPKMSPLTPEQCLADTVGYIVYRSDKKDGTYYQASPLLFEPEWADTEADIYAYNWYRVKVLDTGGYLSEFSEPVLVSLTYKPDLKTIIPEDVREYEIPEVPGIIDTPGADPPEIVIPEDIPEAGLPPSIDIKQSSFSITEGDAFSVTYTLSGTSPITVSASAKDKNGNPVKGFSVDMDGKKVTAPNNLGPGVYNVTVTATNTYGNSTDSFTLNVDAMKPAGTAPKIAVPENEYSTIEGVSLSVQYQLTGTEPITVSASVIDASGNQTREFSIDKNAKKFITNQSLKLGTYTATITAKNDFGVSSDTFTLKVTRKIVYGTAPRLAAREDQYNFTMISGSDFSVQLSATGTQPLTWSLEPISSRMKVPSQASIDSTGLLTVRNPIEAGTYKFIVKAANSFGSDSKEITLTVSTLIIRPDWPINKTDIPTEPISLTYNGDMKALASVSPSPGQYVDPSAISGSNQFKSDLMYCMNFRLTEVNLETPANHSVQIYTGTAKLDIGYETLIPVSVYATKIQKKSGNSNYDTMLQGYVYITEPVELKNTGVKLVSLEIAPALNRARVSGYIKSNLDQNLIGDMYALEFENAELRVGNIIVSENLPVIRYQQFILRDHKELWIRLDGSKTGAEDLITLIDSKVIMKSHLETLNNEGMEFASGTNLRFDLQGRMSGAISVIREQSLQLLVPGGAALRVESADLRFIDGEVQPGGQLSGMLILPFEKEDVTGEGAPGVYVGGHPKTNEMDDLVDGKMTDLLEAVMRAGLVKFGETVQQNGLLIVPDDFSLQDKCSWIPIVVDDWTGKGFVMENSHMSPTRITERSLDISTQRSQAIVVSPTGVTVDLDREDYVQKQGGSQTPNETEKPFWVGLVIKGGTLKLPPDFIQRDGGGAIDFSLAEGEMIYDLNGFNYQTYLYNNDGVPADFGEGLGGFADVMVYDCLLDLYANSVNLEINAEVRVDLLHEKWLKAKLYTNKEDNGDGKKGAFLCSVAPTMIEDALAHDIDIRIDGGFFKKDGLHISGGLMLPKPDAPLAGISSAEILTFSNLVIPADKTLAGNENDALGRKYTSALLTRPVNIDFEGFPMEIRKFEIVYKDPGALRLNLYGATQLSDIIALSGDTTDQLIIECPKALGDPKVVYNESLSVLKTSFDGCVDVSGVLVPKKLQNAGGLVEFDTEELEFNFLQQLEGLPIKAETRFGYDEQNDRCYFAIGMVPESTGGKITLGGGVIRGFTGIVAYNMEVSRDEQRRFIFPDQASQMKEFIESMKVYRGSNTPFAAGIRGTLEVSKLCEIRDLYFGFEPGPSVAAGGSLYLPLSLSSLIEGDGGFTKVGAVAITYSHPDRYFSFSMTLDRINLLLAQVSGSLGFEYSPRLFGVYLGYPETLVGNIGIFHLGMGVGFRIDQDGNSMVQAKMELGLEKDLDIAIVYIHGYLYAGADGAYYFADNSFTLELYLKGGIEGGIRVGKKRFNIIGFYLDARGKLSSAYPFNAWSLACSCSVSYSLDLWLFEIEGSVTASFDTSIDWSSS